MKGNLTVSFINNTNYIFLQWETFQSSRPRCILQQNIHRIKIAWKPRYCIESGKNNNYQHSHQHAWTLLSGLLMSEMTKSGTSKTCYVTMFIYTETVLYKICAHVQNLSSCQLLHTVLIYSDPRILFNAEPLNWSPKIMKQTKAKIKYECLRLSVLIYQMKETMMTTTTITSNWLPWKNLT